jgi:hypothetical protein
MHRLRHPPDNEFRHAASSATQLKRVINPAFMSANALTAQQGDQSAASSRKCLSAHDLSDRSLDGCRPTIIPQYQTGDFFEIAAT